MGKEEDSPASQRRLNQAMPINAHYTHTQVYIESSKAATSEIYKTSYSRFFKDILVLVFYHFNSAAQLKNKTKTKQTKRKDNYLNGE